MIPSPCIVLVRPQMGENIGATARSLANFGLSDLRIVNPRDEWPNQKAIDMASGAFNTIPMPTLYDSLTNATHDCNILLATTARKREAVKPVYSPEQAASYIQESSKNHPKVAFVFGPERAGLENDELSLCNAIINIPTNPAFSSLNLAQAVLLVVYEFSRITDLKSFEASDKSPLAARENLYGFLDRLEGALEDADFFKSEDLKPTMIRNIQNIFTRHDLTEQEVRTLQGVLTALTKQHDPK